MKAQTHAVFFVDGSDQLRKVIGIDFVQKLQTSLSCLNLFGIQLERLSFLYFATHADQRFSAVISIPARVLKFGKSKCLLIVACSTANLLIQKPDELSFEVDSVCIALHDQDLAIANLLVSSRVRKRTRFQQQIESLEQLRRLRAIMHGGLRLSPILRCNDGINKIRPAALLRVLGLPSLVITR